MEDAWSVRSYRPEDAAALVKIHNKAFPGNQMRPISFGRYVNDVLDVEGQVWTVADGQGLVGYAYTVPVPGLENIFDLQGCIDPAKRRQGFGSYLLKIIMAAMRDGGQLSHAVYALDNPTALFLQRHGFSVEHVEWQLLLEEPALVSAVSLPPNFQLRTYSLGTAVRNFRQTYDAIFRDSPWYQPYASTREVTSELSGASDLLFLLEGDTIAGLAWLRMPEPALGEIEPFGLLPAYQGQGLGVKFLTAAIQQLVARGAERVRIGAWRRNERAIRLYRQVGFKHINTQIYLAYNL